MSADDTLREIRIVLDSYERILNQVKRLGRIPLSGPERDQVRKHLMLHAYCVFDAFMRLRRVTCCCCVIALGGALQIIKPREDLKAKFIKLKNAGRAIINTMMPLRVAEQKARELTDLQTRFRLLNEEFKAFREEDTSLGIEQDRRLLLQGAAERKADAIPTASSNDSFLQQGRSIAQDTTLKLRTAMGDLRQADEVYATR
jgi:hypothetical protein